MEMSALTPYTGKYKSRYEEPGRGKCCKCAHGPRHGDVPTGLIVVNNVRLLGTNRTDEYVMPPR